MASLKTPLDVAAVQRHRYVSNPTWPLECLLRPFSKLNILKLYDRAMRVLPLMSSLVTLAALTHKASSSRPQNYCLNRNSAEQIAQNFLDTQTNYSDQLANTAVAPDFTYFSTSVQQLIAYCPGNGNFTKPPPYGPTFSSREAFKEGQGSQPPVPFTYLNVWHTCDTVIARYQVLPGSSDTTQVPVIGMLSAKTVPAPANNTYSHWMRTVYNELDVKTYITSLQDQGVDCQGMPW